jgi:FHS family glucose/mannose:H+ symporter-like MFS transporter
VKAHRTHLERPASIANALVISVGVVALSIYALCYGLLGPSLPLLGDAFGSDLSEQGALMTFYAFGYFVAVVFGGYPADRWGKERVLTLGLAVMGCGLMATGLSRSYVQGLAALAIIGAGGGLVEMVTSAIVSDRVPERRGTALNLLQFVFGLAALSPLLITWSLTSAGSWRSVFLALGAAALLLAPISAVLQRRNATSRPLINLSEVSALYGRPRLWVIAASQGMYVFSEVSLLSWVVTYLVSGRGASVAEANGALSVFWVLFALGRLGCSALSSRVTLDRIIIGLTVGATLALSGVLLAPTGGWVWVLMALTGLFYSGVFGTILAYAGDTYPQYSGTVFGLVLAAGSGGAVLGPWLIGAVAERTTMGIALVIVALAMLATGLLYVWLGPSRPDLADDPSEGVVESKSAHEGELA